MARGRRVDRVASLIRREVSRMLVEGLRNVRIPAGLISVTSVDVTSDLQHCRIFVSIYGANTRGASGSSRAEVMAGLQGASGFVRSELGRRLQLSRSPVVHFREDSGLAAGSTVVGLLQQLQHERQQHNREADGKADDA